MGQEATIPLSTHLFSTAKAPESHLPSKSTNLYIPLSDPPPSPYPLRISGLRPLDLLQSFAIFSDGHPGTERVENPPSLSQRLLNVKEGRTCRMEKCQQPEKAKPNSKPGCNQTSTGYSLNKKPGTCKPADSLRRNRRFKCEPKPFWSRPKSTAEPEKDGSEHFPASPGPSQNHVEPSPHTWAANGSDSFA